MRHRRRLPNLRRLRNDPPLPPIPRLVAIRIHHRIAYRSLHRLLPVAALDHREHFAVPVLVEDDSLGLVAEGEAEEHHASFTRSHVAEITCSPTSRSFSESSAAAWHSA